MIPELTAVAADHAWRLPDAVAALDWSAGSRLLSVAVDGSTSIDGRAVVDAGARVDAAVDGDRVGAVEPQRRRRPGGGVVVAGCWTGPARHVVGALDGTIDCSGGDGHQTPTSGAGPLSALLWTGRRLVAAHRDQLVVHGVGSHVALAPGAGRLRALAALTPSYVAAVGADSVVLVDIGMGVVDVRIDLQGGVAVAADPRRRYIAVGDLAGAVHVLAVGDEGPGQALAGYPDPVRVLAVSTAPDGVVAAADDELTFWAVPRGVPDDQPTCAVGHDAPITALAVSPASPLVATGDAAGRTCVWSLHDLGGPLWRVEGGTEVTTVAWSADGSRLAVGHVSGAVATWTVTPGSIA